MRRVTSLFQWAYIDAECGGAGGVASCAGGFDPAFTECVGTLLMTDVRAVTHARLIIKAMPSADHMRVRSRNDAILGMQFKRKPPLFCSGSQRPID